MSGFLAVVDRSGASVDARLLRYLAGRLRNLGPDGLHIRTKGSIGMAAALFCTTDEARWENQPATFNGDCWVVGKARIDDRQTLAARLRLRKHSCLDQIPASEWLFRAYQRWTTECPTYLLGDYAFAIWDGRRKELVCARDRFGMCQLYYALVGSTLFVSNSLYCLLGHPRISLSLNEQAIAGFLLYGDHTWHDHTITAFKDIHAVPPAHRLVLRNDRLAVERYWNFPVEVPLLRYRRDEEVIDRFREVLAESLADRVRTGKVVIAMSGGMDSSSMAATLRAAPDTSKVSLRAVTVAFDQVHPSDERFYTQQVADYLNIPVHFIKGDDYPFLQPPVPTTRPLELYNPALWLQHLRIASKLGRVMLEGEGGDSLFAYSAGIGALRSSNPVRVMVDLIVLRQRYGQWPSLGTGLCAWFRHATGKRSASGDAPFAYPEWLEPDFERRLGLRELWREHWQRVPSPLNSRHPKMHEALAVPDWSRDATYMHTDFTPPEIRDPFLDLRLVEFVLGLPSMPWLFRKHLLRRAMDGELPNSVLARPKVPLGLVHESLVAQPEARWTESWVPRSEVYAYVDRGRLPAPRRVEGDAYVNMRPLLLDSWLGTLSETFPKAKDNDSDDPIRLSEVL